MWLTKKQLDGLVGAEHLQDSPPVPTRVVSNGEYLPIAQTPEQARVERLVLDMADRYANKSGLGRRHFLRSGLGLAASFFAMNRIYGDHFGVAAAETVDHDAVAARAQRLRDQPIIDVQLHFVRDDYQWNGILGLGEYAKHWNAALRDKKIDFELFKFDNFLKEVYFDSDTKVGLISAAPADHGDNVIMNNDGLANARNFINEAAGSRRVLAHAVIAPGQPGWLDEIDRAIAELKPDSWKGYTLGDPFEDSKYPWRLDDEKLMYPAYERILKSGITNVCIHKGLLPEDYQRVTKNWRYATVDDVGKAAKDWPGLNFIIYHSGFRPLMTSPDPLLAQFERTGRIDWVTDLAEVPAKFGVTNVYAELGTTFGSCAITHPRLAAALLGTVIQGMGVDHVIWGTDSVWYGSPQWQIEAFRRIEIPDSMRDAHGYASLGDADGPIKSAILAGNSARLYDMPQMLATDAPWRSDALAKIKSDYLAAGAEPSNAFYGFVKRAHGVG